MCYNFLNNFYLIIFNIFRIEMFKRKNSLPPRPLPPTKLQLIEDLQATDGHDILFEKFLKSGRV